MLGVIAENISAKCFFLEVDENPLLDPLPS